MAEIKELLEAKDYEPITYIKKKLKFIRAEQNRLMKIEKDLIGFIHSHEIEGKLHWELILGMIQQQQTSDIEMKDQYRQSFGESASEVWNKLPNLNRADEETEEWLELIKELQQLTEQDPGSKAVQQVIGKISKKVRALYKDDEEMLKQIWAVRKSKEQSSQLGWYPLDEKLLRFLDVAFTIYDQKKEENK